VHDLIWEAVTSLALATAIIAIVLALVLAAIALAVILPLAFVLRSVRRARQIPGEPLVLIQARDVVSRAWARTDEADRRSAPVDSDRRGDSYAG